MKMKLINLLCWSMLMPLTLIAQAPIPTPGVKFNVEIYSTNGQSWDGDFQLYYSNASVGSTYGGTDLASGGRQFGPNDFEPHGVLYIQQRIIPAPNVADPYVETWRFPVSMTVKMDETIVQFVNVHNAWREVAVPLRYDFPTSGLYYLPRLPQAPADFWNQGGYIFRYNFIVPQIPLGRFGTYDNVTRTRGRTKFCHGETMYLDTYYNSTYNALAAPVVGSMFKWEYSIDGTAQTHIQYTGSTTGGATINTAWVPMPDPTKPATARVRVAMLGAQFQHGNSRSDGLVGPWSDWTTITIYPPAPTLSITQTPSITTVNDLTETNVDGSFIVKNIACNGDPAGGGIIINKLNQTSGYLFQVENTTTHAIMNFTANWSPSVANPIKLPDDAFAGKGIASGTFPFVAGEYTMKIQNINPDDPQHGPFQCYSEQTFTIKQPQQLVVGTRKLEYLGPPGSHYNVSCALPGNNGQITTIPTGGIAPYDYTLIGSVAGQTVVSRSLTNQPGQNSFGDLSSVLGPTPDGPHIQYEIVATDDAGCPASASAGELNAPPLITIQAFDTDKTNGFSVACYGDKDDLEIEIGGGSDMFSAWLEGPAVTNNQQQDNIKVGQTQVAFFDLSAAAYTIVVRDQNQCRAELSYTVTSPPKIEIESSTITPPNCNETNDAAILVKGKGGDLLAGDVYTYSFAAVAPTTGSWDPRQGVDATFNQLTKGFYTITISDSHECARDSTLEVVPPAQLQLGFETSDVICFGSSTGSAKATFGGGVGPYSLEWLDQSKNVIATLPSPAQTGATLTGRSSGDYYARVTDSHGCPKEDFFLISQPDEPLSINASVVDIFDVSCNGLADGKVTVSVNGGWQPYLVGEDPNDLHGGPSALLQENLAPGIHTFYASDLKGCVESFEVTIHEPDQLAGTADDIQPVSCFGDGDGAFTPNIIGGTEEYEMFDAVSGSWIDVQRVTGLAAGDFQLDIRDARECTAAITITIPTPAVLDAELTSTIDTKCGESNGAATIDVIGGNIPYSAEWLLNGTVMNTDIDPIGLPAGIYTVTITDSKNCKTSLNAGISSSDGPVITVESTTPVTCFDSANGTSVITANGGTLPYNSIKWSNDETGLLAIALVKGPNFVSIEDRVGCIAVKQVDIDGPEEITGTFSAALPICTGEHNGSLTVEVAGGTAPYAYAWAGSSSTTTAVTSIAAGTYSVTITDAHECVSIIDYDLGEPDPVVVDLSGEELICTGQTTTLDAGNPGATYQWTSTNGFTGTERIIEAGQSGEYTVVVTDPTGCKGTDTFELTVDSNILSADFLAASEAIVGDTVVLINISFPVPDESHWEFPDGGDVVRTTYYTQEVVFNDPGEYTAILYVSKGECVDNREGTIAVIEEVVEDDDSSDNGRKASAVRSFSINPNPTNGRFTVNVDLEEALPISLDVISVKAVSTQARYSDYGKDNYEIDVALDVSPGLYTVVLMVGDEKRVKRIIIY